MPESDDNPAFVLLEMLQSAGWGWDEIDTESFLAAAEYFDNNSGVKPEDQYDD